VAINEAVSVSQSFTDTDARYRLGAISYPEAVLSEQHLQSAKSTRFRPGPLA